MIVCSLLDQDFPLLTSNGQQRTAATRLKDAKADDDDLCNEPTSPTSAGADDKDTQRQPYDRNECNSQLRSAEAFIKDKFPHIAPRQLSEHNRDKSKLEWKKADTIRILYNLLREHVLMSDKLAVECRELKAERGELALENHRLRAENCELKGGYVILHVPISAKANVRHTNKAGQKLKHC